jgi:hypothetical protein
MVTWNMAIIVVDEKLALRAHSFLMGSATGPYSSLLFILMIFPQVFRPPKVFYLQVTQIYY